jgi:hypothetical protein
MVGELGDAEDVFPLRWFLVHTYTLHILSLADGWGEHKERGLFSKLIRVGRSVVCSVQSAARNCHSAKRPRPST